MHESMDGSMHGFMDPSMHGSIPAWIHACIHGWVHACIHGWIHASMHASMHGSVHGFWSWGFPPHPISTSFDFILFFSKVFEKHNKNKIKNGFAPPAHLDCSAFPTPTKTSLSAPLSQVSFGNPANMFYGLH